MLRNAVYIIQEVTLKMWVWIQCTEQTGVRIIFFFIVVTYKVLTVTFMLLTSKLSKIT